MRIFVTLLSCLCLSAIAERNYAYAGNPGAGHYAKYDSAVMPLLERMTLAEKIGQMTQADLGYLGDLSPIAELHLGSVLSGGNSDPPAGNTPKDWADIYDACQRKALSTRLGVPLIYGIDAVHGHSNVLGAVQFPHNIGLGCADDAALVEEIGRITAVEVKATGIPWTFAPCVTVPRDDRWGRTYEGFSEDPERVTRMGAAQIRGLQASLPIGPLQVMGCAKHYAGDGGTVAVMRDADFDQFDEGVVRIRLDQGDTQCDEATLRRVHIAPYLPALAAGVGTIMPSYSSWNGVKCSGHKYLLTDVLKDELGFEGFLISDYNAVNQCHPDYKTAVKISINAGMDMAMAPDSYRAFIDSLTELVNEGEVSMERIDDAVLRILRVKAATGLLDKDRDLMTDRSLMPKIGCDEHRAVAREAVRKSLVLLKNDGVLPLAKDGGRVHLVGAAADDLGIQCGGWTISWQGEAGEVTPGGTTILAGLREVSGNAARFTHSDDGSNAQGADVAIVVVGEQPYAEGIGDYGSLELSDDDKAVIAKVAEADVPMVLVLLSGRPMILGDALDAADAVVAAWLPGTEGDGVADVLLGDHAPSGTLSFTWPKSADQHPINVGDAEYEPLFEYGYGLSY